MTSNEKLLQEAATKEPNLTGDGISATRTFKDDPVPIDEFTICMDWLEWQKKAKKITYNYSSYTLKHWVERFLRDRGRPKYISNGAMVAAIIASGLPYEKDEQNVFTCVCT